MALYDNNGTASTQIGKVYDNNGTTNTQIGKIYDNNGTTSSLIYTADQTFFNGTTACDYTGGWAGKCVTGTSVAFTTSGASLSMQQTNYADTTAAKIISNNPIAISGASTLKFTYSATRAGNGVFTFGITTVTTDWDVYDTATNLTKYYRISAGGSGTASVNISGISGSYYIRMSVFDSTGNSTLSVTKIWVE